MLQKRSLKGKTKAVLLLGYFDCQIFNSRDLAVREIPIVIDTIGSINEFEKLCYIADKLARDTGMVYIHFAQ